MEVDSGDGSGTPPHPPTILGWSSGGGLEYLSRPRYRPPTPMVIKEIPLKIFRNKKISREISCKKFKNHLQFYMKIFLKKISSFFTGKSLVKFFQNHYFETIFQKVIVIVWFWKNYRRPPTSGRWTSGCEYNFLKMRNNISSLMLNFQKDYSRKPIHHCTVSPW